MAQDTFNYINPLTQANAYGNSANHGKYQYITLKDIVESFAATYLGEEKILGNTLISDVVFHAHRALQELHYDTLRSCKAQEFEVCDSLVHPLPHDYINYVKVSWIDNKGIQHVINPAMKTLNPSQPLYTQDDTCSYVLND